MADRSEIDEVRSRVDLVSVIEQYVTLKRNGPNLKGLCPFHNEKTPSFHVNPSMGVWKCFGQCNEGGDVFKFLQKIDNLSFAEALERLALRAGVTLSPMPRADGSSGPSVQPGERDRLYAVNAMALRFYQDCLAKSPAARDYVGRRNFNEATRKNFFLGYAPDSWEGLANNLRDQRVVMADAEKAGLVTRNDYGGYRDKLRDRLIFPILDVQERPIAFGGRLIGEAREGQPKYWNSPETPVFSKSRTLYGLWRARKAISSTGKSIVVEGYTDVVAAHEAGFENVVATLGTSLTEEHVKALARLAPKVLLAFDADSAGLNAAYRAAEIFQAHEVEVFVLDLPDGEDPDSLLSKGQKSVFAGCVESALPLVEYQVLALIRKSAVETEQGRIDLFRKALPILASVPSAIEREQHIRQLAQYHPRFSSGTAHAEAQIRQDVARYQTRPDTRHSASVALHSAGRRGASAQPQEATEVAEYQLLRALTSGVPELAARVFDTFRPEEFLSSEAQQLAGVLYDHYAKTGAVDPAAMMGLVDENVLVELLTGEGMRDKADLTLAVIDDDIIRLRSLATTRELTRLQELIAQGNAEIAVIQEFQRLHRVQSALKAKKIAHVFAGKSQDANEEQ